MKIKAEYLKKIIKEELRSVLYGEPMKQDVIHIFIKAIELQDPEYLKIQLNKIGVIPQKAIFMLKRDEVDPQFYQNACHMHNEIVPDDSKIKIDAFTDFPNANDNQNATPMNKLPTSTAQLDYRSATQIDHRKGKKNYIQEKKK